MYASPAASTGPLVSVPGQTLHQAHAQAHAKLATGISELCRQATGCTGWLLTNGLDFEQLMHPAEGAQQAQGLGMALGKAGVASETGSTLVPAWPIGGGSPVLPTW